MKRLYLTVLSYFLLLHVWGPTVYYILFGFFRQTESTVPESYVYRAAIIITIPILFAFLIIAFIPMADGRISSADELPIWYYMFGMGMNALFTLLQGGFSNALGGALAGSMWSYSCLFFDKLTLLMLFLCCQKHKKNFFMICFIYLGVLLLGLSRSAALQIFFVLICMATSFESIYLHKKQIIVGFLALILSGPVIFIYTSNQRDIAVSTNNFMERVVGRFSIVELGGTVVYQKDHNLYVEELAQEKYSIGNQFEQIVNSLAPGNIFPEDVDPNQYFRTIFFGTPEEEILSMYTSLQMSLPIYYYMKYSLMAALIVPIVIIVGMFVISSRFTSSRFFMLTSSVIMYQMLGLFDWVMLFHNFFSMSLTLSAYNIVLFLHKTIKLHLERNMKDVNHYISIQNADINNMYAHNHSSKFVSSKIKSNEEDIRESNLLRIVKKDED